MTAKQTKFSELTRKESKMLRGTLFLLKIKEVYHFKGIEFYFIANDDELNILASLVEAQERGCFTLEEITRTIKFIHNYVDAQAEFQIIPNKMEEKQ